MSRREQQGGNTAGLKWNKGGAYKRNSLSIDFSCFADFAERIENLGGDLKEITDEVLTQAAETIAADTYDAMDESNLPAKGKYSTGTTIKSVIRENQVKVEWSGNIAEVGVGFNKDLPGAGGFLITGTPRMAPNHALEDIFSRKKYQREILQDIQEGFEDAITDLGG